MIIALCGLPRCGKDTFAHALSSTKKDVVTYSFALPFKKALCEMFGWKLEDFENDNKELIDPFWGVSKREMMEYLGSEICRSHMRKKFPLFDKLIADNIWVKRFELFYKENKHKTIIITDLRYKPEYEFLKTIEHKKIIMINRPNYTLDTSRWYDILDMNFDCSIDNDVEGDISNFNHKAFELYDLLKRG